MMKKCSAILMAVLLVFSAMLPSFSSAEDVTAESAFENRTPAPEILTEKELPAPAQTSMQVSEALAEKESPAPTQTPAPADTPSPANAPNPAETSKPTETPKVSAEPKEPDTSGQSGIPGEQAEVRPEETKETDAATEEQRNSDQTEMEVIPEASEVPSASETQRNSGVETDAEQDAEETDVNPESSADPTETEKAAQEPSVGDADPLPETSEEQESKEAGAEGDPAGSETEEEPVEKSDPTPTPVPSQLSTASSLKLTSTGLTSMTLTFKGDTAPTKYRVYRATSKSGKYTSLGLAWEPVAGKGSYYYEDLTAKKNVTYYYKVRAYITEAGEKTWAKKYSDIVSGKTKPAATEKVSGKSTAAKTIKVSWTAVKGASGYQVARSTNLYSGYSILKNVTSGTTTSYSDKTAETGKQYYYRVRAFYAPASGSKIYGSYTYSSVILCQPVAPKNFKISEKTDTSVTFSWTTATDIEYYQLTWSWKQDGVAKKEEAVIAKSRTSYKVKGLTAGTDYTFEMRSIAFSNALNEMRSGVAVCKYSTPAAAEDTPKSGGEAASEGASGAEQAEETPSAENGDQEGTSEGVETAQSEVPSESGTVGALNMREEEEE